MGLKEVMVTGLVREVDRINMGLQVVVIRVLVGRTDRGKIYM